MSTPDTVKKIHKMILHDRRLKVRKLAKMIGISKTEGEKAVRKMGAALASNRAKTAS